MASFGGAGRPTTGAAAEVPVAGVSRGFAGGLARGLGGSTGGLGGLPCDPAGGGLGAFFTGGLSLRGGGGMAPGFSGTPLGPGGGSGLFFEFLGAAGLRDGDEEKDRDLERLPLKELCAEE